MGKSKLDARIVRMIEHTRIRATAAQFSAFLDALLALMKLLKAGAMMSALGADTKPPLGFVGVPLPDGEVWAFVRKAHAAKARAMVRCIAVAMGPRSKPKPSRHARAVNAHIKHRPKTTRTNRGATP